MRDLTELRLEIDRIDRQIVELFEQRMEISGEVAEYKVATGKRILDKERENQKLEAVKAMTHNEFNSHGVEELYKQLMAMSRKLQYQLMEKQALGRLPFIMVDRLEKENVRVVYQGRGVCPAGYVRVLWRGCQPFSCGALERRHGRHRGRNGRLCGASHRKFHRRHCE